MSCGCPLTACLRPGTLQCECDKLHRDHVRRHTLQQAPVTIRLTEQQQHQRYHPVPPDSVVTDPDLNDDADDFRAGM